MKGDRRSFLKQASLSSGAAALSWSVPALVGASTADTVRVGVIGCARGRGLARDIAPLGASIAYACDPDEARAARVKKDFKGGPQAVSDLRRVLDDKSVDAVLIATPDHWHAAAMLLALAAGKHVYVEKPCSHNIHEGRLMVKAARRGGRVVQVGSQTRGTAVFQHAVELLRGGAIGDILVAKAWTCQKRPNIGHEQPSEPPQGFDYDLWVGPAPMRPFQRNCQHYQWHWWYDFGTGDAGNRGVHEMDVAVWGMGIETHPSRVIGYGSKLYFDDDQQFPDTQYVTFEFPGGPGGKTRLLIYEQRIWSPSLQDGLGDANAFYGTDGYMILSKHTGWKLYDPKHNVVKEEEGVYSVPEHTANFLDAIRSGAPLSAPIEVGHRSATLAHLANILARTGCGALRFDPTSETFRDAPEADALLHRTYREGHWAVPREA